MSMDYIRETYKVPAKVGGRVTFQGQPGVIKSAKGSHLKILLDGEKTPKICHPTWEMKYLEGSES